MKSRIAVKSGKCAFQIDQFQGRPSPKNAFAVASKNRRRFASRAICLPKSLEAARLLRTVRTSRLGRQSAASSGNAALRLSLTVTSGDEAGRGAATDKASVSAILATCLGSQKHSGGSGWGSWSNVLRWARIRQAFLVSRQPSVVWCTPGPCPGSRVRIRPPSHSTTANSGGLSGRWAKASAVLGSASRRSASSQPTSCTTRSIVLAEIGWSPTFLITNPARSNERVSAAANVIRWINKGVSSRASNPSVCLSGEKGPAAGRAITLQLLDFDRAVDRGHRAFPEVELATDSAFRARNCGHPPRDQIPHLSGLDLTTELLSEFVSPRFDHGIMGNPGDRTVGTIEGHRDLGCFYEQPVQFLLQHGRRPIHEPVPPGQIPLPKAPKPSHITKESGIPPLTISPLHRHAQKLTCTLFGVRHLFGVVTFSGGRR